MNKQKILTEIICSTGQNYTQKQIHVQEYHANYSFRFCLIYGTITCIKFDMYIVQSKHATIWFLKIKIVNFQADTVSHGALTQTFLFKHAKNVCLKQK